MADRDPGEEPDPTAGRSRPMAPPVVQASTFGFDDVDGMVRAAREGSAALYSRWSNPTVDAVEARLAALEGADGALLTASGMAAIHAALMAAGRRGGPLLIQREVYGGTDELVEKLLPRWGFDVRRAGVDELPDAAAELPAGSTIHLETPTNPRLRVVDLPALRRAAPSDATIAVDATFATPVNLRPLEHGADLVVHSASKYLGGHHDLIAGVVAGGEGWLDALRELRKLLGPVPDPAMAARLDRGLETLELRVARQSETAAQLAARLAEHPAVEAVHHPSRPEHPDRARAGELLRAGGGVLAFEVAGGREGAARVADRLQRIVLGPSLGGVSSLLTWPAGVSHVGLTPAQRRAAGVTDGLLRLAVGIEPVEELWADLAAALR